MSEKYGIFKLEIKSTKTIEKMAHYNLRSKDDIENESTTENNGKLQTLKYFNQKNLLNVIGSNFSLYWFPSTDFQPQPSTSKEIHHQNWKRKKKLGKQEKTSTKIPKLDQNIALESDDDENVTFTGERDESTMYDNENSENEGKVNFNKAYTIATPNLKVNKVKMIFWGYACS